MSIRYLCVHPSKMTPKMSVFDQSHVPAIVHRHDCTLLNINARDVISIFFEQTILTNYLLAASPNDQQLLKYLATLQVNFKKYIDEEYIKDGQKADPSLITDADLSLITKYIETGKLPGSSIDQLVTQYTGENGTRFSQLPKNFAVPYLNVVNQHQLDETYENPVVLSARRVTLKDGTADTVIHFFARTYSSMKNEKTPTPFDATTKYVCSMNYNGRSWKEVIDVLQSLSIASPKHGAVESLSGALKRHLYGWGLTEVEKHQPFATNLLQVFKFLTDRYPDLLTNEALEVHDLIGVFRTLGEPRLQYLASTSPTVGAVENWNKQFDLQFLDKYRIPYGMEADDDTASSDDSEDKEKDDATPADDTANSEENSENEDDSTGDDTGDDPFSDGDDFGDDSSSEDGEGDGSSSSETDTSSDSEVKPEDLNPLIELIDNESFDDYLERGSLQNRLKALINNPPSTIRMEDIDFLKYWMTQWFSLVSVATTREILGDLLELE